MTLLRDGSRVVSLGPVTTTPAPPAKLRSGVDCYPTKRSSPRPVGPQHREARLFVEKDGRPCPAPPRGGLMPTRDVRSRRCTPRVPLAGRQPTPPAAASSSAPDHWLGRRSPTPPFHDLPRLLPACLRPLKVAVHGLCIGEQVDDSQPGVLAVEVMEERRRLRLVSLEATDSLRRHPLVRPSLSL